MSSLRPTTAHIGPEAPWHDQRMSAQPPQRGAAPGDAPRGPRLPTPAPKRFRFRWWIVWILGLLVLNYVVALHETKPAPRIRVPYSPFFLEQVRAGHVHGRRDLQRLEARQALRDGDPGVREHDGARRPAAAQARRRQRRVARERNAVVEEPALRLRADDPLRRADRLGDAAHRRHAERARPVRTCAGAL